MEKVKQVIVMRKDLNMRKGKMISQEEDIDLITGDLSLL